MENNESKETAPAAQEVKVEAQSGQPEAQKPEANEAPKEKQLSFEGLFAEDFSIGSRLEQKPGSGGNVLTNIKKPTINYVEQAKNHKNLKMTTEELKALSNKK